jgi:endonuclease YncB( thermonuclease family)
MRIEVVALLWLVGVLAAVETKPVPVLEIIDGSTIVVGPALGSNKRPVYVRMLWVDTPECPDNAYRRPSPEGKAARDWVARELPKDQLVTLWAPGDKFEHDLYGRIYAVVFRSVQVKKANGETAEERRSINKDLIRAGLSPLWRKAGDPPGPLLSDLQKTQDEARKNRTGLWNSNPEYMEAKAGELPVVKLEKGK